MKKVAILLTYCFVISWGFGQSNQADFQSHPKTVLEEIFRAANEEDYSNLEQLCPPDGRNDGDTQQYICDIASGTKEQKAEFISYFKTAKIRGEISYSVSSSGNKTAQVPFWFNHPGGEGRSNETMNLVRIDGKWYLAYF